MPDGLRAALATARLDIAQFNRSRVIVLLAVLEAITFLVLVSLFGLTGSRAPTAIVDKDHGTLSAAFVQDLANAHHSFALRPESASEAQSQISKGDIVSVITIPKGFTSTIEAGRTIVLPVTVDNLDTDLTDDIREAVPSAIVAFGREQHLPGIRMFPDERDVVDHETGFVPYLVVSALVLDALVVAGILGALAVTREYEGGTIVQWQLAPIRVGWLLAGKLAAAAAVSAVAVAIAAGIVIGGYGVHPVHAFEAVGVLALCVVIFTALGAVVGALLRRTLPVAALFFGLSLPFYIDSGALEPERFDGTKVWVLGHLSPVYSAIGVLENAFHGLRVTPETLSQNYYILAVWTLFAAVVAAALLTRRLART